MRSVREIGISDQAAMAFHDQCPAAHLLVGGDGRIRDINQTLAQILGYEKDEVTGRHVLEFVEPRDTGRVLEELHRGPIGDYEPALEVAVRAKDGTGRTLLLARSLPPPELPGAEGVTVLLTGIDITDTRTAEEMLHQRELRLLQARHLESVGRLADGVARHFDGLISTIANCAEQLGARSPGSDARARAVEGVRDATTQAARLTARLRDFAQDHPLQLEPVDGGELIASTVESLRPRLGAKVAMITDVPSDLPMLPADACQLREALVELGLNASDAMPAGGRITLAAEAADIHEAVSLVGGHDLPTGRYLRITVADTGAGMGDDTLASAFEPFFTTKDPGRWAGLGLSKVYGCVAAHRGAVRVESHQGRGTRVTVLLPVAPTP